MFLIVGQTFARSYGCLMDEANSRALSAARPAEEFMNKKVDITVQESKHNGLECV